MEINYVHTRRKTEVDILGKGNSDFLLSSIFVHTRINQEVAEFQWRKTMVECSSTHVITEEAV